MNRFVTVTVRWTFEGWHYWPDAPSKRDYLGVRHRHLFHGEASIAVAHDDREVEFHDLLDVCRAATDRREYGPMSCELIADLVARAMRAEWPDRQMRVAMFEDGECGAEVSYDG